MRPKYERVTGDCTIEGYNFLIGVFVNTVRVMATRNETPVNVIFFETSRGLHLKWEGLKNDR
jgi:hypothetical protein